VTLVATTTGCSDTTMKTVSLSVGINELSNIGSLSLYPNPLNDVANINLYLIEKSNVTISIYDFTGKLVDKVRIRLTNHRFKYKCFKFVQLTRKQPTKQ